MRQALPQMISLTEPQCRDATEQHLHPRRHGQRFTNNAVHDDEYAARFAEEAALEVELEIDAEDDLGEEEEAEVGREGGVDVVCELAAFVFVAEGVADDGEEGAEGLRGDVPAGADDLVDVLVLFVDACRSRGLESQPGRSEEAEEMVQILSSTPSGHAR